MTEQEEQFLLAAWRLSAPDHIGTGLVEVRDALGWDYQMIVDVAVILHESGAINTPDGGSIIFTSRGRLSTKVLAEKKQAQKAVQVIEPARKPGIGSTIMAPSAPKSDNPPTPSATAAQQTRRAVAQPRAHNSVPPRPPPIAVPYEPGNEVPIPEAFNGDDFDAEELRYLLAAYQLHDGGRFNWRALRDELQVSIYDCDKFAAHLQAQGAIGIKTSDGHAEFTDPARYFLRTMLTGASAADCSYWTSGQRLFVFAAAYKAGPENRPFIHDNLTQYRGDIIRRDLIQRGVFEATGPNKVKTTFTPAGLEQLRAAYRRIREPEFMIFDRPEIAAIDKYLEMASNSKKPEMLGRPINTSIDTSSKGSDVSALDSQQHESKPAVRAPRAQLDLNPHHEPIPVRIVPDPKPPFFSKSFSLSRVTNVFDAPYKLVVILIGILALAGIAIVYFYGGENPFKQP